MFIILQLIKAQLLILLYSVTKSRWLIINVLMIKFFYQSAKCYTVIVNWEQTSCGVQVGKTVQPKVGYRKRPLLLGVYNLMVSCEQAYYKYTHQSYTYCCQSLKREQAQQALRLLANVDIAQVVQSSNAQVSTRKCQRVDGQSQVRLRKSLGSISIYKGYGRISLTINSIC